MGERLGGSVEAKLRRSTPPQANKPGGLELAHEWLGAVGDVSKVGSGPMVVDNALLVPRPLMKVGTPEKGPRGGASDLLSADSNVSVEIAFRMGSRALARSIAATTASRAENSPARIRSAVATASRLPSSVWSRIVVMYPP
jgi:hypothetical protein